MSNIILLDIETFGNKPTLDEVKVPSNYKKEEAIQKYKEEHLDEQWRKNALNKFESSVIAISAYYPYEEKWFSVVSENEEELMKEFDRWLIDEVGHQRSLSAKWVGAFIGEFDLPIIRLRAIKYGLKHLALCMPNAKFSDRYEDILSSFMGTSYKDSVSVKTLAKYFGLDGKTDGLDGSAVHDLWLNKEYEKIAEYCKGDVKLEYELHKLLKM